MVSLYKIIRNLFRKKKIRKIERLPSFKPLRAHLLGLSIALVVALLNIIFNSEHHDIATNIFLIFWFAVATYLGGFLVFFTLLLVISPLILGLLSFILGFLPGLVSTLQLPSVWYLLGYCFGFTFAIFYNDIVYLFIRIREKAKVILLFAYDPNKKINIIKSPNESEEIATGNTLKTIPFLLQNIRENVYTNDVNNKITPEKSAQTITRHIRKAYRKMSAQDKKSLLGDLQTNRIGFRAKLNTIRDGLKDVPPPDHIIKLVEKAQPLVEKYLKLREKKLYHFNIESPPEQPYTIAFVANPTILKHEHHRKDLANYVDDDFKDDPIMKDKDLFLKSVNRALQSFDGDDVLGKADILSRIRIVTIFDNDAAEIERDGKKIGKKIGLLEEFQETRNSRNGHKPVIHYIADPRKEMHENVKTILDAMPDRPIDYEELDVIYAITASPTHDRSMAHNSDYTEVDILTDHPENRNRDGIEYTFDIDPCDRKRVLKNGKPDPGGISTVLRPSFEPEDEKENGKAQASELETKKDVKGGLE